MDADLTKILKMGDDEEVPLQYRMGILGMASGIMGFGLSDEGKPYTMGETGVNRAAGVEIAGVYHIEESTWHRASDTSVRPYMSKDATSRSLRIAEDMD